jgi:pyruvate kinase
MIEKSTKIVATIGPVTESEEMLEKLILAGANVARFNTKHNIPVWHQEIIARVKKVAKKLKTPISTLLDLQGPEIRIDLKVDEFAVEIDEKVTFTSDRNFNGEKIIYIDQVVIDSLKQGNTILIDDGYCEFMVVKKEDNAIIAKTLLKGLVKKRKTMNIPGVTVDLPSLIDRDYEQLDGVVNENIDYVALSFVRNAFDIKNLRMEMKNRGIEADIVAKIETQKALDNLGEIIDEADAVMVARGDLGIEVPYEELIFWQKKIIDLCIIKNKPVITATQMLKSMCENLYPTRAEVSDVANAIYDQTDAVMLSEETTAGKYPVEAVATQAKIAQFNEKKVKSNPIEVTNSRPVGSLAQAAFFILQNTDQKIDAVVCLTEFGETAKLISRFRPNLPIIAITNNKRTYEKLPLVFGVNPIFLDINKEKEISNSVDIKKALVSQGVISENDTVLLLSGSSWIDHGRTNNLAIL